MLSAADDEQTIICEGCGSRWRIGVGKGRAEIKAILIECPLCEGKEVGEFER